MLRNGCAPVAAQGIDPSEAQLAFARSRPAARVATFMQGDAMALPFPDESFDAAVMALVCLFVPDARKGVAEMVRVVRPGSIVASYTWDILHGGFPNEPLMAAMRESGRAPPLPPSSEASRMEALKEFCSERGLEFHAISAATNEGTRELVRSIADALDKIPKPINEPHPDADETPAANDREAASTDRSER